MATQTTRELSQAFQERQSAERSLYQAQTQLGQTEAIKRRSELTLIDLNVVPDDAHVDRTVGRVFIRDTIPEIKQEIGQIIESSTTEIANLQKTVTVLEKRFVETDLAVRELAQLNSKA